ncbi:MAG: WG repeat-containing protein [Phaeodactylibacter sp.]|nr:WG repeat-containing protein [Phaeodactylibacter sp.]
MPTHLRYQLLAELLAALRADGYPMGPGKHLQLQELLRRIPDDTPPERLRTLLAPIFATNKQEQAYFYEVFEKSWARVQAAQLRPEAPPPPPDKAARWRYVLLGTLVVLTVFLAFLFRQYLFPLEPVPLEPETYQLTARPGDTVRQQVRLLYPDSLYSFTFCDNQTIGVDSFFGHYAIDSMGLFNYVARDTVGPHILNLCVIGEYAPEVKDTNFITLRFPAAAEEPVLPDAPVAELEVQPLPYPRTLDRLRIDPAQEKRAQLYRDYGNWAKLALTLLLGALLYAFLQWREQRRRKLVAELESRTAPPYVFNIETRQDEPIAWSEQLQSLLNVLRRRALGEAVRLDLPATIHSTVKQAGRLSFRYRQQTRPPEYLFLVERHSQYDHRARLYDLIYHKLRENEVYALRYFYDGDLRLCFDERAPHGVGLKELAQKYGASRLLIVGSGHGLLSPMTGKLSKWTNVFSSWRQRAILSPLPSDTWGRREERLAEQFQLAPASLQGLEALADQFDAKEAKTYDELLPQVEDAPKEPILIEGDFIQSLQRYYPPRLLDWIAACAVYPSLEWDLTLHLGDALSGEEDKLLTADNLFQLFRLPWFIDGRIPQGAREALLGYLRERGLEEYVRRSIHALLESQQPNPASAAYDDYRMNVVLNELLFTKDTQRKKELEEEFARYLAAGHQPDFVTFKYLEREQSPLDLLVPDSWKKYLYRDGLRHLGWQHWLWALPAWLLLSGLLWWWQPAFELCDGQEVEYKEQRLCLRSDADRLLLAEFRVRDRIPEVAPEEVDSLVRMEINAARSAGQQSVDTFYRNVAVAFYNQGAGLFNQALQAGAGLPFPDSICGYFSYAARYDSLASDTAALFLREALQACVSSQDTALADAKGGETDVARRAQAQQQVQLQTEIFTDKNGQKGLRQKDGAAITKAEYRELDKDPETGLYRFARDNGRKGYLNSRGQVLFEDAFSFLGYFSESLVVAAKDRLYGYLNSSGKQVIPYKYSAAEGFKNNRAEVVENVEGKAYPYVINKFGTCIQGCLSVSDAPVFPFPIFLYFDEGQPLPYNNRPGQTRQSFPDAITSYLSKREEYLRNNDPSEARRVNAFFDREISSGLSTLENLCKSLLEYTSFMGGEEQLVIEIQGYDSPRGTPEESRNVTRRRIQCVRAFIESYAYEGWRLKDYIGTKIIIRELPLGETRASSTYPDNDPNSIWGIAPMLDRRVEIIDLFTGDLSKEPPQQTIPNEGPEQKTGSAEPAANYDYATLTDPRDNQTYRTLSLNGLTWMADNLNYAGEKQSLGVCYDNDEKNCARYGRLYTWQEARLACPGGWRLPTYDEWRSLIASFDQPKKAGSPTYEALLEGGETGFAAKRGGYRYTDGSFEYLGLRGYYWTATDYGPDNAWGYVFDATKEEVERVNGTKSWGFSCRCVKE